MILCFDIGGSAIKIAHAYSQQDVRPMGREATPGRDLDAFLDVLRRAIADAPEPPTRLSFSIAGAVDPDTGVANVANIPCMNGKRVVADLSAALGLPVVLANDADCFAMAEAVVGAGRGHDIVFGVILGTGIGGGIVVRGELINPDGGMAGEWGHGEVAQRVVGDPQVVLPAFACGCGNAGCLDSVCGARGMERLHSHLHPGANLASHAIVDGWQRGRAEESRTIAIWLEILTGPMTMAQNMLGAGIIAVGGGLSNARPLVGALDRAVRDKVLRKFDRPLIVPAECRIEPGLVGAAILGLKSEEAGG
ncbi:ROK family protein [Paracoccus albus]|uniref:ROK family protein n=1 Tax=Paracoccus albus TaxID=3017784 RepID=UPI0022F0F58F|nr:ROK family protein [Paracoccus albus]WBU59305.1 ROK family protein [Paracoccus albus]